MVYIEAIMIGTAFYLDQPWEGAWHGSRKILHGESDGYEISSYIEPS